MKRFLLFIALLPLAGANFLPAQMIMENLPEHRETYANTEHVPQERWGEVNTTTTAPLESPAAAEALTESVPFGTQAKTAISIFEHVEMSVFPNPTRNEATFRIVLPSEQAVRLDLVNSSGQLLRTYFQNERQPRSELTQKIGLFDYPAGVYYLRVRIGQEIHSLPVVKQ